MKGEAFAMHPCKGGADGALSVAGGIVGVHRDPRNSDARGRDRPPTGRPGERARVKARAARAGKRLVPLFVSCQNGPFPETQRCQGMRRAGAIRPRPFEAAAYASQRRKRPDYPV